VSVLNMPNGKSRKSRSKKKHTSKIKVNKVDIKGRKLKVSPHPPEFVPVPWYNLTVRMSGITDITISQLIGALRSQLNLGTSNFIQIRVIDVRLWGPIVPMNSTSSLTELRVSFWALYAANSNTTGGTFSVQEEVFDFPDQVRRAAVGYEYPLAQQQLVFNQNSTQPVLHCTYGGGTGNLVYFRVLWRSSATTFTDSATFDPVSGKFVYYS
jgi:hypothetical protein